MSNIDPDRVDHMDRARALIDEMIAAMLQRAVRDKYNEEKLKDVYRNVVKPRLQPRVYRKDGKRREPDDPSVMWPGKPVTYGRLFGFGDQAHAYLPRSKEGQNRRTELYPITERQLEHICATLTELKIYGDAPPPYGHEPASWFPFLSHSLRAIEGRTEAAPSARELFSTNEDDDQVTSGVDVPQAQRPTQTGKARASPEPPLDTDREVHRSSTNFLAWFELTDWIKAWTLPRGKPNRLNLLLARFEGDGGLDIRDRIKEQLTSVFGEIADRRLEVINCPWALKASRSGTDTRIQARIVRKGRRWLRRARADLLIWGRAHRSVDRATVYFLMPHDF